MDDHSGKRPSLFMNVFREIHERLQQQEENANDVNINNEKKLDTGFASQASSYLEFLYMIPWTESWMIGLLSLHVFCFIAILMTRNRWNTQYLMFFCLLASVLFSEKLNDQAALHWRSFAKENYFDSNGLFISTVWSSPILFNCLVLIIMWLYAAGQSMIDIKRKQLAQNTKIAEKKESARNTETKKEK